MVWMGGRRWGGGALSGSSVIKRRRVMDGCGGEPNGRRTLPPVPRSVSSCRSAKEPWKLSSAADKHTRPPGGDGKHRRESRVPARTFSTARGRCRRVLTLTVPFKRHNMDAGGSFRQSCFAGRLLNLLFAPSYTLPPIFTSNSSVLAKKKALDKAGPLAGATRP